MCYYLMFLCCNFRIGPATIAALGVIIIPAMINAGYGKGMSSALIATSGQ